MAVIAEALVGLDETKTMLGISVGTYDTQIENLIGAVSLAIQGIVGPHQLIKTAFTEDYSGGIKANQLGGARRLRMDHFPIVSVASITDDNAQTVPATDYTIVAEMGWLEHNGNWPVPDGRWTIVFTAGIWVDETEVEMDMKMAAWTWISLSWGGDRLRDQVKSEKVGMITVVYGDDGGVPDAVMSFLSRYMTIAI